MLAPLIVAEIVPERKARLLLVSSHASPPSSRQSFQKATVNFRASIVSLLLMAIFPLSSISAPPKHHVTAYAPRVGVPEAVAEGLAHRAALLLERGSDFSKLVPG